MWSQHTSKNPYYLIWRKPIWKLCSNALVCPGEGGRQAEMAQSVLSHKLCKRWSSFVHRRLARGHNGPSLNVFQPSWPHISTPHIFVQQRLRRNNNKNLLVLTVQPLSTLILTASTLVATLVMLWIYKWIYLYICIFMSIYVYIYTFYLYKSSYAYVYVFHMHNMYMYMRMSVKMCTSSDSATGCVFLW